MASGRDAGELALQGLGRPEVLYRLSARGEGLFPRRHGDLLRELVEFLDSRGQEEVPWSFFDARSRRKLFDLLPCPFGTICTE